MDESTADQCEDDPQHHQQPQQQRRHGSEQDELEALIRLGEQQMQQTSASRTPSPAGKGRPFLRKGSRREPSAKNRALAVKPQRKPQAQSQVQYQRTASVTAAHAVVHKPMDLEESEELPDVSMGWREHMNAAELDELREFEAIEQEVLRASSEMRPASSGPENYSRTTATTRRFAEWKAPSMSAPSPAAEKEEEDVDDGLLQTSAMFTSTMANVRESMQSALPKHSPLARPSVQPQQRKFAFEDLAAEDQPLSAHTQLFRPPMPAPQPIAPAQPPTRPPATVDATQDLAAMRAALTAQAAQLQEELEFYKRENANIRKLKKQHEAALKEIQAEREDMFEELEREKAEFEATRAEQLQAFEKEKRIISKQTRLIHERARQMSSKKDRIEIEALQATIEKMKLEHEAVKKKWRATEKRLLQQTELQRQTIESLQHQVTRLEKEREDVLVRSTAGISATAGGGHTRPTPASRIGSATGVPQMQQRIDEFYFGKQAAATTTAQPTKKLAHTPVKASERPAQRSWRATATSAAATAAAATSTTVPTAQPKANVSLSFEEEQDEVSYGDHEPGQMEGYVDDERDVRDEDDHDDHQSYDEMFDESVADERSDHEADGDSQATLPAVPYDPNEYQQPAALSQRPAATRVPESAAEFAVHRGAHAFPPRAGPEVGRGDRQLLDQFSSMFSTMPVSAATTAAAAPLPAALLSTSQAANDVWSVPGRAPDVGPKHAWSIDAAPSSAALSNSGNHQPAGGRADAAVASADQTAGAGLVASTTQAERTEHVSEDGTRTIRYRNGTIKEIFVDGRSIVRFNNGDVKKTLPGSGMVVYYYAEARTTHTTYKNGLEVYEFPNKQIERHFPDGTKEIIFPDKTKKFIRPSGVQESIFPDGVTVREYPDGTKEIRKADGVLHTIHNPTHAAADAPSRAQMLFSSG